MWRWTDNRGDELLSDAAHLKVQNGNTEPIYLFIYDLRGHFLCTCHFRETCLDAIEPPASSRLGVITKQRTNSGCIAGWFPLFKANLGTVLFFFFQLHGLEDVSGLCAAVPPELWLLHTVCPTHNDRRHPAACRTPSIAPCPFPAVSHS